MRIATIAFVLTVSPSVAEAGGLDIPTLYSARHVGMGGAAIAYVDDASAVYHNPAGLGGVKDLNLLTDVALFLTAAQTSPDYAEQDIRTGRRLNPAAFFAAAYRVADPVALGVGFYPLGAVGGTFEYANQFGNPTLNEQQAIAVELTPAIAIQLPGGLSIGAGYRVTFLDYDRRLGPAADPSTVDVDTFGTNYLGVRVGAQFAPNDHWALGVVYRHRVDVSATAPTGRLLGQEVTDIEGRLAVPAKFGAGTRVRLEPLSLALDYELVFNSQFDRLEISGKVPNQGTRIDAPFIFNWHDSSTLKLGGEYALGGHAKLRAGYAWDEQFINEAFPSTFSSPPTDGHYITAGFAWDFGAWEVNVALVHRLAQEHYIREESIASTADCAFCGSSGNYVSRLSAASIDFSIDIDTGLDGTTNTRKVGTR